MHLGQGAAVDNEGGRGLSVRADTYLPVREEPFEGGPGSGASFLPGDGFAPSEDLGVYTGHDTLGQGREGSLGQPIQNPNPSQIPAKGRGPLPQTQRVWAGARIGHQPIGQEEGRNGGLGLGDS